MFDHFSLLCMKEGLAKFFNESILNPQLFRQGLVKQFPPTAHDYSYYNHYFHQHDCHPHFGYHRPSDHHLDRIHFRNIFIIAITVFTMRDLYYYFDFHVFKENHITTIVN